MANLEIAKWWVARDPMSVRYIHLYHLGKIAATLDNQEYSAVFTLDNITTLWTTLEVAIAGGCTDVPQAFMDIAGNIETGRSFAGFSVGDGKMLIVQGYNDTPPDIQEWTLDSAQITDVYQNVTTAFSLLLQSLAQRLQPVLDWFVDWGKAYSQALRLEDGKEEEAVNDGKDAD